MRKRDKGMGERGNEKERNRESRRLEYKKGIDREKGERDKQSEIDLGREK